MAQFELETVIAATRAEVFAASLDPELHVRSMAAHGETMLEAPEGGEFREGSTVTWRARHFGIPFRLRSMVFDIDEPRGFRDRQIAGPFGAFLHEPEGSIIRARLIGDVARSLGAGPVAEQIAYLTGDADARSPFATTFRVRETLPADPKPLARALRERGIGTLEIKKRGVDIDPAEFRKKLKLSGTEKATLFVTRIGARRTAILADRLE